MDGQRGAASGMHSSLLGRMASIICMKIQRGGEFPCRCGLFMLVAIIGGYYELEGGVEGCNAKGLVELYMAEACKG